MGQGSLAGFHELLGLLDVAFQAVAVVHCVFKQAAWKKCKPHQHGETSRRDAATLVCLWWATR